MSSKYVLASGCSWTDAKFQSVIYPNYDCSFPKWPELFADRLGLSVQNLGRCGASNQWIYDSIVEPLLDDHQNVECVVLGMSEAWRFTIFKRFNVNALSSLLIDDRHLDDISLNMKTFNEYLMVENVITSGAKHEHAYLKLIIDDYISNVIKIQKLCRTLNVKLVMTSLFGPLWYGSFQTLAKHYGIELKMTRQKMISKFVNNTRFFDVDPKSFMGWPMFPELKGFSVQQEVYNKNLRIGHYDGHPNAQGHELIAQAYYDFYKKTYL